MQETLHEFADSRGQKIGMDRSNAMIRGVKILGVESRNGRTYLSQAIRDAAPLYEEAKVNVNHHHQQLPAPRDYRDRIGVIRNISVREGEGLFADFHFNPKHELAEQFLWDAEHAPENVGFSHNVTVQTSHDGEKLVIEKILKVQSVDLVADPATTNGLFEAVGKKEANPGLSSCKKETDATSETTADFPEDAHELTLAEVTEARDLLQEVCNQLHRQLAQLREELLVQKRLCLIEKLFAEAGLSRSGSKSLWEELVCSNDFIQSLLKMEDENTIREQIHRRAELLKQAQSSSGLGVQPHARERLPFSVPEQPSSVESFVGAITS